MICVGIELDGMESRGRAANERLMDSLIDRLTECAFFAVLISGRAFVGHRKLPALLCVPQRVLPPPPNNDVFLSSSVVEKEKAGGGQSGEVGGGEGLQEMRLKKQKLNNFEMRSVLIYRYYLL